MSKAFSLILKDDGRSVSKVLREWIPNVRSKVKENVNNTSLACLYSEFILGVSQKKSVCTRRSVDM